MKQKTFIWVIVVCLLVPILVFGAYQFGSINGYNSGFKKGQFLSQFNTPHSPSGTWLEGYQAGLQAAQNNTTP